MNNETLKIIYCITAFQLFFFGFIAIFLQPKRTFNYWLAAFLFLKFILLALLLACCYFKFISISHRFWVVESFFDYLLCPVFYAFVITAARQKITLSPSKLLFLIPFIINYTILYLPEKLWASQRELLLLLTIINYHSQAILYFYLSFKKYNQFQSNLSNYLSQEFFQRLKWLKLVIFGFLTLWSISMLTEIANIYISGNYAVIDGSIEILFLVIVNILIFLGAKQLNIVDKIQQESNIKYASSSLDESKKTEIIQALNKIMVNKRLYRTPNLTLNNLAERIDIQPKHLSQVINEKFNRNFREYINYLRIEEAKQQLADKNNSYKTILEIIYDTGFNSKSVFNTIFKENTGYTPTAFRNLDK